MTFETPLTGFKLIKPSSSTPSSIVLEQDSTTPGGGWRYELQSLTESMVRVKLNRLESSGVIEGGLKRESDMPSSQIGDLKINEEKKSLTFTLPSPFGKGTVNVAFAWSSTPQLIITDSDGRIIHRDLTNRGYVFDGTESELAIDSTTRGRQGGVVWFTNINLESKAFGLGEKAAPIDLTRRKFTMDTTNAALYDAFHSDPLYKNLPFLLMVPNPQDANEVYFKKQNPNAGLPLVTGIYTPSAATGLWDLGCEHNDPHGNYKKFTQIEGPFDAIISWAPSQQGVKNGWRSILQSQGGADTLAGRSWFGYLASTMGQAESDNPPAQELLMDFPAKCKQYGIPVSALHLSSGYTVDKVYGYRMVFQWNRTRYPDFAGLWSSYHGDGIKVTANVKPYVSTKHPDYEMLRSNGALFHHPVTGEHATTQVWSGLWDVHAAGSWVDISSKAGRDWWYNGIKSLVAEGIDSAWNDDNEFSVNQTYHAQWEVPETFTNAGPSGPKPVALVGKPTLGELMGYTSQKALQDSQPGRRVFVLTRSMNVGALAYTNSSWTGDNRTSWKNFRGNVAMGINGGVSFLHNYGDDIGGFGGPLPSPELLVRWVQSAIYRSRFCIHSFKPTPEDPSGNSQVTEPWMYPEVLPIVREVIERRYEVLPYIYDLAHRACNEGLSSMTWLGWGIFERDPGCYDEEVMEGQDFWIGTGKLLIAGCYHPGVTERRVYLPSCATSGEPDEGYFDLHTGLFHAAGQTVTTPTPLTSIGTFARAGTVIPIGKPCVTVTATSGPAFIAADGTPIKLKSEGGVVELDDFRGVEIFPSPADKGTGSWEWEWTEDDGESSIQGLQISKVKVEYSTSSSASDEVIVKATWTQHDFKTLWTELWVVLPKNDKRTVKGGRKGEWRGRTGYWVSIE